jgi:hypothetical protein
MNVDRIVMFFAGAMVLIGLALMYWVSSWWVLLPIFVGANLMQASITGFCPLAIILKKLGTKPGSAFR